MHSEKGSLKNLFDSLFFHRQLIWELTRRDFSDRYVGQILGTVWAIINPLIFIFIYIFIFAFVFKLDITAQGGRFDYPVYILAGLIPWLQLTDAMSRSVTSITMNGDLVKQVIFPIELLPIKSVLTSFITQIVLIGVVIIYVILKYGVVQSMYWGIPVLFVFELLAMIGMGFLLSAVAVFFRDLKDIITAFSMIGIYIIPVLYLPDMVPQSLRLFLYLNPFSYPIWCFQDVFYYGSLAHPVAWLVFGIGSIAIFIGGYRVFTLLREYFGNVL
jgi:lipopolysaccharide transport system permease protein